MGQQKAPRFCYGHKVVSSVDGFTAPVKQGGIYGDYGEFPRDDDGRADLGETDQMAAAFPRWRRMSRAAQPGQMMLATAGAGWQVPQ